MLRFFAPTSYSKRLIHPAIKVPTSSSSSCYFVFSRYSLLSSLSPSPSCNSLDQGRSSVVSGHLIDHNIPEYKICRVPSISSDCIDLLIRPFTTSVATNKLLESSSSFEGIHSQPLSNIILDPSHQVEDNFTAEQKVESSPSSTSNIKSFCNKKKSITYESVHIAESQLRERIRKCNKHPFHKHAVEKEGINDNSSILSSKDFEQIILDWLALEEQNEQQILQERKLHEDGKKYDENETNSLQQRKQRREPPIQRGHNLFLTFHRLSTSNTTTNPNFHRRNTSEPKNLNLTPPSLDLFYLLISREGNKWPYLALNLMELILTTHLPVDKDNRKDTAMKNNLMPDKEVFSFIFSSLQNTRKILEERVLREKQEETNNATIHKKETNFKSQRHSLSFRLQHHKEKEREWCRLFYRAYCLQQQRENQKEEETQQEAKWRENMNTFTPLTKDDFPFPSNSQSSTNMLVEAWAMSCTSQDRHDAPMFIEMILRNEYDNGDNSNDIKNVLAMATLNQKNCWLRAWERARTRLDRFEQAERLLLQMEVFSPQETRPNFHSYLSVLNAYNNSSSDNPTLSSSNQPHRVQQIFDRLLDVVSSSSSNNPKETMISPLQLCQAYNCVLSAFTYIYLPVSKKTQQEDDLSYYYSGTNEDAKEITERLVSNMEHADSFLVEMERSYWKDGKHKNASLNSNRNNDFYNNKQRDAVIPVMPDYHSYAMVCRGWVNVAKFASLILPDHPIGDNGNNIGKDMQYHVNKDTDNEMILQGESEKGSNAGDEIDRSRSDIPCYRNENESTSGELEKLNFILWCMRKAQTRLSQLQFRKLFFSSPNEGHKMNRHYDDDEWMQRHSVLMLHVAQGWEDYSHAAAAATNTRETCLSNDNDQVSPPNQKEHEKWKKEGMQIAKTMKQEVANWKTRQEKEHILRRSWYRNK